MIFQSGELSNKISNRRRLDSQEWDGSDAEVEELSRLGQKAEEDKFNQRDESEVCAPTTRSKSRAAEMFKNPSTDISDEKRVSAKTLNLNSLNKQSLTSLQKLCDPEVNLF